MNTITLGVDAHGFLEASWSREEQSPDILIPGRQALFDDQLRLVLPAVEPGLIPGDLTQVSVRYTSYHPTQRAMLEADALEMGTPLDEHVEMLDAWVASYVPDTPVTED